MKVFLLYTYNIRIKAENVSDTESDPEIEENVSNEYAAVNQHNKKQQMLDEAETLSAIQVCCTLLLFEDLKCFR